jgi:acetyl-CoA acyltransferase 1
MRYEQGRLTWGWLLAWRACHGSRYPRALSWIDLALTRLSPDVGPEAASDEIKACGPAVDSLQPMGWTGENVAREFNISREDMDEFAARSFQRAEAADKAGHFAKEIVPFTAYQKDAATGARKKVTVSKDDGIRYGTTRDTLLKIKSAFPQWPPARTTGGNASQVTDGAAAVLLMTRKKAEELGLRVLAKYANIAISGGC